jgi:protein phosphatase
MQLLSDDVEIVEEVKEFKFSELAHVATLTNNEEISKNVQKVSINSLEEANKKLSERPASVKTQAIKESHSSRIVLNALYKTKDCDTCPPILQKLQISKDVISKLLVECLGILQTEPTVLSVRTPAKVFGDLYGQYHDLLRYFSIYKGPLEGAQSSDIDSFDYIFLGNYVDRGKMSLETILLIFALKVKFPKQIHLLRGYQEIKEINKEYGFGEECKIRLEEDIDSPASIFNQINNLFDWLPVAALIDNALVCMHSGIGNIMDMNTLHKLQRPIPVSSDLAKSNPQQLILLDILQSFPLNDDETAIKSIKKEKFGKSNEFTMGKLSKFLNTAKLKTLIRGHFPLTDGMSEWPNEQLCSIFSASNYGGVFKNPGCILSVTKTYKLIPKYIPAQEDGNSWIQTDDHKKRCPLSPLRKLN